MYGEDDEYADEDDDEEVEEGKKGIMGRVASYLKWV